MKYILLGNDFKVLYIESDDGAASVRYNKSEKKWYRTGSDLNDARVGFDPYEPEGSPYRYGCLDCMKELTYITKEEAEEFISSSIDEEKIKRLLNKSY